MEPITRLELGLMFKRARVKKGISQLELARLANVSPTTIRAIEKNKNKRPRDYILSRIATILDINY